MRSRMGVLASVVAIGVGVGMGVPASAAGFGDPLTPAQRTVVIRTTDLHADAGRPISVTSLQWGAGARPSGCILLDGGKSSGRPAPRSFYREILAAPGLRWQSAVYEYSSVDAAIRSYEQLQNRSLAACSGVKSLRESPDGDAAASTATMTTHTLPNTADDRPRFTVSSDWVLDDPASAPAGAADRHAYTCFMLVDTAIIDVVVFSPQPITSAQRLDARRIATTVGARHARASG